MQLLEIRPTVHNSTLMSTGRAGASQVLLWELVTGELPRRGRLRPVLVPEECSEDSEALILACMHFQPERRPTAKELVAQLQVHSPSSSG